MRFGELLLCNSTSDCLETAWVSSWGSGLSIWIEIVLWKQGLLFLEPFKITDRSRWNMRFGELLLCNSTSDCLETTWVSSWGSGLSIWIKIVLWKQGVLFLKPIQNHRQKRWNMRFGVLLLCNSTSDCLETAWVLSWRSGLSIWIEIVLWKQGVFLLKAIQNHRQKTWNMRFGVLLLCNSTSDCLETAWVSSGVVDCQSELKLFCGNREFYF